MSNQRKNPSEYFQDLFQPPKIVVHSPSEKVNNILNITTQSLIRNRTEYDTTLNFTEKQSFTMFKH